MKLSRFVIAALIPVLISGALACKASETSPNFFPSPTSTLVPTSTPLLFRQLETDAYIKGTKETCTDCNSLTLVNGNLDAVVILPKCAEEEPIVPTAIPMTPPGVIALGYCPSLYVEKAIYMRAKESITLHGLDGYLIVCFTQGEDWDSSIGRFTRNASYSWLGALYISATVTIKDFTKTYNYQHETVHLSPFSEEEPGIRIPMLAEEFPDLGQ